MNSFEINNWSLHDLLHGSTEFVIPELQRPYSWGKQQVVQFLSDVMEAGQSCQLPYFIGSIVVTPDPDRHGIVPSVLVLDGQQRLTTILLILAEIRRFYSIQSHVPPVIHSYLKNQIGAWTTSSKLLPQSFGEEPTDLQVFEALIADPLNESVGNANHSMREVIRAVRQWINDELKPSETIKNLEQFFEWLMMQVHVIRIKTTTESDACKLFETLNNRGLPLTQSDLIKNRVFKATPNNRREEICDLWAKLEKNTRKETDLFLRAYWIANHDFVRRVGLFDVYKEYLTKECNVENTNTTTFMETKLVPQSQIYHELKNPPMDFPGTIFSPEVYPILRRLKAMSATSCIPFLMSAFCNRSQDEFMKALRLAESLTLRHSFIAKKTANVLEKLYGELASDCRSEKSFKEILKNEKFADVPSDETIVTILFTSKIAGRGWRRILMALAQAELPYLDLVFNSVDIEHILPQKETQQTINESGISSELMSSYIHRLGNQTPLYKPDNISLSNEPFSVKRPKLIKSQIPMTRRVGDLETWGAKEIEERTSELARKICELFPHPSNLN